MIIIGNSPLPYHVQIWYYPEHLIHPSYLVTVSPILHHILLVPVHLIDHMMLQYQVIE